MEIPTIIQGGMGVAISTWRLARAVSEQGQLGVVSGTGIGPVMLARLMNGDPDGQMRHALGHFPFQEPVQRILDEYYVPGGIAEGTPYKMLPLWTIDPPKKNLEVTAIANFVEIFLAIIGFNDTRSEFGGNPAC